MSLIKSTQGEDYVETGSAETDLAKEGTEVTKSADKFFGLSPAACVVLVALLFVVIAFFAVTHAHAASVDWYDENGSYVGSSADGSVGSHILNNGVDVGIISSSGVLIMGTNGTNSYYQPISDVGSVLPDDEVRLQLKKLGYSGDEIDLALSSGMDVDALIAYGEELADVAAKEALHRMSDEASEEFQYVVNNSIYFMQYYEFPEFVNDLAFNNRDGSYIVNADYEKMDTYGHQLFIKLKIANDDYAFMSVTPDRWRSLPSTGNIVVRVDYTIYGMGEDTKVYFKNLSEVTVTELTSNPEDSSFDLNQITGY